MKSRNLLNIATSVSVVAIQGLAYLIPHRFKTDYWWLLVLPALGIAVLYYLWARKRRNDVYVSISKSIRQKLGTWRNAIWGALAVVAFTILNAFIIHTKAEDTYVLTEVLHWTNLLNAFFYSIANILTAYSFVKLNKELINMFWLSLGYAILQFLLNVILFSEDFYVLLPHFIANLTLAFMVASNRTTLAFGFSFVYALLPTKLICNCVKIVAGIFAFSGVSEMGYTPAFLYSFQIVAMGAVAAYYGRLAYLVSMNRAELVDRGYMMVRDQHGVETPMLRATYQYNIMQAIKPWIALTEAGKKRHRGMVITQKLQKGWAFHEVFNAQGEPLTHGFIDANMDLERMSESRWQDNRPKLAIAWELDTEALYYLRVEFEGETLYGALRMFFNAEERAKQPQNFAYKLSNTWIHPNEEEILTCVLYKASGEEVLVKALYGKYHDN